MSSNSYTLKCDTDGSEMLTIGHHLFECPECQLISSGFPFHREIYDEKYLANYEKLAQTELGKQLEGFRWGFVQRYLNGHRSLLDYGCGSGAFINSTHKIPGVECAGWDINPHSKYTAPQNGGQPHDILTLFDVIEHMESPRNFLAGARAKLLIILTPNVAAVPKGLIHTWRHYKPKEHLHYYSIESLRALLNKTGYHLDGWDFIEGAHRNPNRPMDLVTVAAIRK